MRPALALLACAAVFATAVFVAPTPARAAWPSPVFEDNLSVDWDPKLPTELERVTIVIRTILPNTFIKGATVYLSITDPENTTDGPFPNPMVIGDPPAQATFGVRAYPNATKVEFYIIAWDFENDVVTSRLYSYRVQGAPELGWQHLTFEENVLVTQFPPIPQPHVEVNVSIRSREPDVRIDGANLYLRYIYRTDPPKLGGFVMRYLNGTDLNATIPAYPPGTQVSYWIVAWDKDVDTLTSPFFYYNLSVDKYTRHENLPFPSPEAIVGYSLGLALLVPVSLYFVDVRRKRRSSR